MMFGDETFPGLYARQIHVMVHKIIKVSIPITTSWQPSKMDICRTLEEVVLYSAPE